MPAPSLIRAADLMPAQWRPLRVFNLYRIAIAGLFLGLPFVPYFQFLGRAAPALYIWVSMLYILFALSSILASYFRRPPFRTQVHALAFVDILAITLLVYSSGGISTGLGILLVVAVAGVSLLTPDREALFYAALASIAVLLEEGYAQLHGTLATSTYPHAGFLGIALFATALLTRALARRARESLALAEQRGIDLANMTKLNEYIVNCMSRGIIVVDEQGGIRLINKPAARLLGVDPDDLPDTLQALSTPLHEAFSAWRANPTQGYPVPEGELGIIPGLKIRLTRVGKRREDRGCIFYLEDADEINRHIQETKLASLGRLTASISHEIRNPLGAISHAAQLLGESSELSSADQRLVGIVNDNARRMNEIIRNVLQLSRKTRPHQEPTALVPWVRHFVVEFARIRGLDPDWVEIVAPDDGIEALFDPSHLHQVMWNLCTNALRYARTPTGPSPVTLRVGHSGPEQTPCIEVVDGGPGIDSGLEGQIFEPFFTTSTSGTGLGLYISRQLCLDNGGDLSYEPEPGGGSRFTIRLPRHQPEEVQGATRAYR